MIRPSKTNPEMKLTDCEKVQKYKFSPSEVKEKYWEINSLCFYIEP